MGRNKNTAGTGDRGPLPESLVGKLLEAQRLAADTERRVGRMEQALEELADGLRAGAGAAPAPKAPPAPDLPPAPVAPPPPAAKKKGVFDW